MLILEKKEYIDNTNKAFDGTMYANSSFKIQYHTLTRTQLAQLEKTNTKTKKGVRHLDVASLEIDKFIQMIDDIEGVQIGEEEVKCTVDSKRQLADQFPEFTNLVMLAISQNTTGLLDREDDDKSKTVDEEDKSGN